MALNQSVIFRQQPEPEITKSPVKIGGKDINKLLQPEIISRPLDVDKKLRLDRSTKENYKSQKIGQLVDQFRIMCKQPTEKEMSKKGAPKFRRPAPVQPARIDNFTKRTKMTRYQTRETESVLFSGITDGAKSTASLMQKARQMRKTADGVMKNSGRVNNTDQNLIANIHIRSGSSIKQRATTACKKSQRIGMDFMEYQLHEMVKRKVENEVSKAETTS